MKGKRFCNKISFIQEVEEIDARVLSCYQRKMSNNQNETIQMINQAYIIILSLTKPDKPKIKLVNLLGQKIKITVKQALSANLLVILVYYQSNGYMHGNVNIVPNRQKMPKQQPKSRYTQRASSLGQVEQYIAFEEGIKMRKNLKSSQFEEIRLQPTINSQKSLINAKNRAEQKSLKYQLPKEIVQFIGTSQKRSIIRERQDIESLREYSETNSFFIKSSYISDFSQVSRSPSSSLLTQLLQSQTYALENLVSESSKIYGSKFQRQLLSTSEFRAKLQKILLIQEQPAKQYNFVCELGKGSMCRVYKAISHKDPLKNYAVRIIFIEHQVILDKLKEEITVMTLCQSWNIIRYYFSYYFEKTLFMFIEYMDHGSLNNFIKFYGKAIPQSIIAYIIRQILKGLHSIHKRRQVHRDLKSDNILINSAGEIKIGDFGYAIQLTKDSQSSREIAGTPAWMAPELIKKEEYTESVDIWSLGIILVELCQGEPRYLKINPFMAMIMIATKSPETVTDRSLVLQNFLTKCLQKDPFQRATTRQLLSNSFITSIGNGINQRAEFLNMLKRVPNRFF